jgi:glycopeptide antibiotics resistance protein
MIIPTSGVSLNDFPGRDKLLHFGVFGLLGFLFTTTVVNPNESDYFNLKNWKIYLLLLFSLSIEFVQLLLTYRTFEFFDILMNGLGLVSGLFIGNTILRRVFRD